MLGPVMSIVADRMCAAGMALAEAAASPTLVHLSCINYSMTEVNYTRSNRR